MTFQKRTDIEKEHIRHQPVLNGNIYCAPRCGAKCKKAAYDRAVKEAGELAAKMGDGWEPRVFENMGWHYSVRKGVAEIYARKTTVGIEADWEVKGYCCYLNTVKQFVCEASDVVEAYGLAAQDARTAISRMEADLAAIME